MSDAQSSPSESTPQGIDLSWVWREVRKRVFIKVPFSLGVADALEAVVPIVLDGDAFVVGLVARDFHMAQQLNLPQVHNTVENILRSAAGRPINLEVIEGVTLADWQIVKESRQRAQEAMIAMASQETDEHHVEDILSQIVGEIRRRVSALPDRALPQVRAGLLLDIAPSLADAAEMLFDDPDARESKRAMSRVIDRVSNFLEMPPIALALEMERHRRSQAGSSGRATKKSEPMDLMSAVSHPGTGESLERQTHTN